MQLIVVVLFVQCLELLECLDVGNDRLVPVDVVYDVMRLDCLADVEGSDVCDSFLSVTFSIADVVHKFNHVAVHTLSSNVATNISRQIEHLIFSFVIVGWWLDEEMFMSIVSLVISVVPKCRKVVVKHSVSIVLSNTTQLNDAIHLFRIGQQVSVAQELLEVLTVEFKWLLGFIWKLGMFRVFLPVTILVHDKGWNESHDRFEERVHDDKLACGAHKFLHFRV